MVTVLGGLIIALLGSMFQDMLLSHKEKLIRIQKKYDKKYELLYTFCREFESSLMLLSSMQKVKIKISANMAKLSEIGDTLDRQNSEVKEIISNIKELKKIYNEKLGSKYYKQIKPKALFVQIKALYDDEDGKINKQIELIDTTIEQMQILGNQKCNYKKVQKVLDKIEKYKENINQQADILLELMGKEIYKMFKLAG